MTSSISSFGDGGGRSAANSLCLVEDDGDDEEDFIDRTSIMGMNPMYSPLQKLKKLVSGGLTSHNTNIPSSVSISSNTRQSVTGGGMIAGANPRVMYSIFKYMWSCGHKTDALEGLEHFCSDLSKMYESSLNSARRQSRINSMASASIRLTNSLQSNNRKLLGRCMLKVGKWKLLIAEEEKRQIDYREIIKLQRDAADIRPNYYKAWHSWALMNYQMMFLQLL